MLIAINAFSNGAGRNSDEDYSSKSISSPSPRRHSAISDDSESDEDTRSCCSQEESRRERRRQLKRSPSRSLAVKRFKNKFEKPFRFFVELSNLPHSVTEHEIRWFLGPENGTVKLGKVNREDERLYDKWVVEFPRKDLADKVCRTCGYIRDHPVHIRRITEEEADTLLSFVAKQDSQTTDDSDLKQQVSGASATASTATSSESVSVSHNNVQNQDHSSGETFAYSVEQFIHAAYYNYAQTTALLAKGSAAALNDFAATGGQYLQWHPGFSGNQRAYFPAMRRTLLCVPQVFFKVTPRSTIPQRRAPAYERREVGSPCWSLLYILSISLTVLALPQEATEAVDQLNGRCVKTE
ncbi:unnamed protein product [Toxocara canis]|uniref:RRM domain-containing protein n=1 Tax=Toxocara canis TaxID=6265 RepID=A0A183V9C2_TOXCA|nr:unnamed protein product [Toxocara canis]